MAAKKEVSKSGNKAVKRASGGFTREEQEAMKARAAEGKADRRRVSGDKSADGEAEVLASLARLSESDRGLGERLHALIKATAPELTARTWYGMPAYAREGDVICFFQASSKFKTRYSTLGFSDKAKLDAGTMWPVAYALKELNREEELAVAALVKRALGR